MKYLLLVAAFVFLSGCAGKKLVKNCSPVGKTEKGDVLSECENL